MRVLHVVSTYDQMQHIEHDPDDRVALVGTALYGERYDKVVDHTFDPPRSPAAAQKRLAWWDDVVSCRIAPGGEIVRG